MMAAMTLYRQRVGSGQVPSRGGSNLVVLTSYAHQQIAGDIVFLTERADEEDGRPEVRKRYARAALCLLPLYAESVANAIYHTLLPDRGDPPRGQMPQPLEKLRAVYWELFGSNLELDCRGIWDVFRMRNNVTSHSQGKERMRVSDRGRERLDRNLVYNKIQELPLTYGDVRVEVVHEAVREVTHFLHQYLAAIGTKLTAEQRDRWWPKELEDLLKKRNPGP